MMTMKSEETIEEEYSAGSRLMQFEYCLKLMSKEPLTGVGLGNFHRAKIEMLRVSDEKLANLAAHNAYLAIGAETGIFGLLAFVLVVSCSIYYLRVSERIFKERGDTLLEAISKGTKIGLIGLSVCIFFLTEQYNLLLYQSIALSVVLRKMSLVEKDSKNNKVELLPNV
jgi:O-antigen ligase